MKNKNIQTVVIINSTVAILLGLTGIIQYMFVGMGVSIDNPSLAHERFYNVFLSIISLFALLTGWVMLYRPLQSISIALLVIAYIAIIITIALIGM